MGPTWGATRRYWKQSPHQAVQRALRCSAQQRNSNEYWNDLQTGAGLYRSALIDTRGGGGQLRQLLREHC